MTIATRQEGPRAPLFYCALLIAPVQLALAQSVDVGELERCAAQESAAARLACYEALTRVAEPSSQSEGPAAQPEAEVVEIRPEPEEDASASTPPASPAQPSQPVAAAPTQPEEAVQEVVPIAPAATAPASASSVADDEPGDPMEGLGIEEPDPGVITGRVMKVTKDGYGRLVFHFDNDQVWRQLEKRYYPYPKNREFDVTISTGMMGALQLQVEGAGRKVTIKRLR